MKIVVNNDGWSEVTTVNIIISKIVLDYFSLSTWLDFNERHPKIGRNREICKCCRKSFKELGTDICLAISNKGNQPICTNCGNLFIEKGIESMYMKQV